MHPEIDADELEAEEEAHHEPVEEADIFVKKRLLESYAVEYAEKGRDRRPEKAVEDGRKPRIGDFHGRIIDTPQHGQQHQYEKAFKVEVFPDHRCLRPILDSERNVYTTCLIV